MVGMMVSVGVCSDPAELDCFELEFPAVAFPGWEGAEADGPTDVRAMDRSGLARGMLCPRRAREGQEDPRADHRRHVLSAHVPALDPRFSYRAEDVVGMLEQVCPRIGYPKTIRVDQGSEFVSRDLDLWACTKGVTLDVSRPGKPNDNAYIEAFNGRFRAECLNALGFLTFADAAEKMEDRRRYYNEERPHGAIGHKVPISLLNPDGADSPPPPSSYGRRSTSCHSGRRSICAFANGQSGMMTMPSRRASSTAWRTSRSPTLRPRRAAGTPVWSMMIRLSPARL